MKVGAETTAIPEGAFLRNFFGFDGVLAGRQRGKFEFAVGIGVGTATDCFGDGLVENGSRSTIDEGVNDDVGDGMAIDIEDFAFDWETGLEREGA